MPSANEVPAPQIAAFDFDGTLTYKDSFTAFLVWHCGYLRLAWAFISTPSLISHYIRTRDRGALKSRLIHKLLGGIRRSDLEALIAAFADSHKDKLFRPDALATWAEQKQPDRLRVIVTASPDILVSAFGTYLEADRVIGTKLGFSADNRLLPDLDGLNCRGPEKVARLKAAYGESMQLATAFGDTSGDFEMIKAADKGYYRVFTGKPT
ncbi:HAD-IB family hydrolase [Asticcacaulis machinosus]|uniref:HAD-IB family hydrolase n=1 Tax=Asticcacaulis machinosus TaxID=2984211 RepID=A0ABT5HEK0_9CAUL|nr:HAD-IB family hydrolase [Asticcacaulis machinosus]MDC7674683.1 HAD-IB family hydrolase [Asticcacaulis machinosus]